VSLRYEWGWDFGLFPSGATVTVDDDGAPFVVTFTTGTYIHTSITDVDATAAYDEFAAAFETALNAGDSGSNTYLVTYHPATGYEIDGQNADFTLTFASDDAGVAMRHILGFSGNQSGNPAYNSDARPYYLIIPVIQGRSLVSDEYEPEGISVDAISDDATAYQTSRSTAETLCTWTQMAEVADAPAGPFANGTYIFEREATSTIPWTYQHAFRHARDGKQPFLVVDGSDSEVHELRADGTSFHPQRFGAQDFHIWNVPFRTRKLGVL
jgi:hypothetical protein